MVAAESKPFAPNSPREPLSRNDAALLDSFIKADLNPEIFAAQTGRSYAEVIDWADQPAIRDRIESYQRLVLVSINTKLTTYAANARIKALKHLQQLSDDTTNPIERRRTAHLTLRYALPLSHLPTRALPSLRPTDPHNHPDVRAKALPASRPTEPGAEAKAPLPPRDDEPRQLPAANEPCALGQASPLPRHCEHQQPPATSEARARAHEGATPHEQPQAPTQRAYNDPIGRTPGTNACATAEPPAHSSAPEPVLVDSC